MNVEPERQAYIWSLMRQPARWVVNAGNSGRAECKSLPKALTIADAFQKFGMPTPHLSAPDLAIELDPSECAALWLRLQLLTA